MGELINVIEADVLTIKHVLPEATLLAIAVAFVKKISE